MSVTRPDDWVTLILPPSKERWRSFVRSTTTKLPLRVEGYVNRIRPALLVDVVSNLIPFTNVVVKYPGVAAIEY